MHPEFLIPAAISLVAIGFIAWINWPKSGGKDGEDIYRMKKG